MASPELNEGWLVEPLRKRRRYARRPHHFKQGEIWSDCEVAHRTLDMLPYDVEKYETTTDDPRLKAKQFRRPCYVCLDMQRPGWVKPEKRVSKQTCVVCGTNGYWVGFSAEHGEDRCLNHLDPDLPIDDRLGG